MFFGSDNQSGASEQIIEALVAANQGVCASYGDDQWTEQAVAKVREVFEHPNCSVYFVTTGTAANCLALSSMVKPWQTIICHHQAHIAMDESTAPEFFTGGARLITLDEGSARLSFSQLQQYLQQPLHAPHNPVPGALSLTQSNEAGQVYRPEEITQLADLAHAQGMKVHMDGARFSNALVSLGCSPADLSWRAGVDVLCLGASKNGCLSAEMVVIFDPQLAVDFEYRRKRTGHLLSKGRLLGSQVLAWFADQHWLDLARHANRQAQRLAEGLKQHADISVVWPVEANSLFVLLPRTLANALETQGAVFYDWDVRTLPSGVSCRDDQRFVRMVTSFVTSDADLDAFLAHCQSV